jgi:signal transduction histidine kinase
LVKGSLVETLHPVPRVFLDPVQIRKVVTNLVLNASDAAGAEGEIHVTTGTRNGWAVLTVSDNGCGMSRAFLDDCLFRPFKTTKRHGTGIGLFHSKMIVDAHKGRMEVATEEGKGSTFRVLLRSSGKGQRAESMGHPA